MGLLSQRRATLGEDTEMGASEGSGWSSFSSARRPVCPVKVALQADRP